MDSLSYLIQNNNEVIIDQNLLKNLQKKSPKIEQGQLKQQEKPRSPNIKTKYVRKLSPKLNPATRLSPKMEKGSQKNILFKAAGETTSTETGKKLDKVQKAEKIEKVQKVQKTQKSQKTQKTDKDNLKSKIFSQQQTIEILNSKIQTLKLSQKQMESKYTQTINNLKSQLHKRNEEYENQCEQFNKIKNQLKATKTDISSLIKLLTGNSKQEEKAKGNIAPKEQKNSNIIKNKNPKDKSILSNFTKSGAKE